ncbi:MAG: reverse transcriptase family protein [Bacteroidota bacterium]
MNRWPPIPYQKKGLLKGIDEQVIDNSLRQAHSLQGKNFPPLLTLGHLAFQTDVSYYFIRKVVARDINPYRTFSIKKRSGGRRYINVPEPKLMKVQKWIDQFILSKIEPSAYSYAFNEGKSIVECAEQHLQCRWLIKLDLRHFFESLSEIQAYHVFKNLGYDNLISFELARICTKVTRRSSKKYHNNYWLARNDSPIPDYYDPRIGHLPQGVPTSPKLSNIIVKELDNEIQSIANKHNLCFTRYADDITISTYSNSFNRNIAVEIIRKIYALFPKYGLRPNPQKAKIIPPGARKLVLGLLVDSNKVRLSKSFRKALECHLYFCAKDPIEHAKKRGFDSVLGLKNFITGKLAYTKQVDAHYHSKLLDEYGEIDWPI